MRAAKRGLLYLLLGQDLRVVEDGCNSKGRGAEGSRPEEVERTRIEGNHDMAAAIQDLNSRMEEAIRPSVNHPDLDCPMAEWATFSA